MSHPAIRVEALSKQYELGRADRAYQTLRDSLAAAATYPFRRLAGERSEPAPTIWALKDVTFDVAPGEVVGLIGRNGAGKSTLLKVLSRITEPTSGRARIRGRVASLLEVGTGFHAELSGRENLFLNGAILGMSKREILRKFDEIVAFAEVDAFIDTPVKRYSSGMYLRLAFAVAAHLEPEILVVDEVLAVGDAAFQSKCLGKMEQVAGQGRTVLFVSHNMTAVRSLCSRCLWIRNGGIGADGTTGEVIDRYLSEHVTESASVELRGHPGRRPANSTEYLERVTLRDRDGKETPIVPAGDALIIDLDVFVPGGLGRPRALAWLVSASGERLFTLDSILDPVQLPTACGKARVRCHLPELPLIPGRYYVNLAFGDVVRFTEVVEQAISLEVVPSDYFGVGRLPASHQGSFLVRSSWNAGDANGA